MLILMMGLTSFGFFFCPLAALAEVLWVDDQQSKRLPVLFFALGVVGTMRPQDSPGVLAVELPKPLETLMNIYIVNQEVNHTINRNPDAYKQQPEITRHG